MRGGACGVRRAACSLQRALEVALVNIASHAVVPAGRFVCAHAISVDGLAKALALETGAGVKMGPSRRCKASLLRDGRCDDFDLV